MKTTSQIQSSVKNRPFKLSTPLWVMIVLCVVLATGCATTPQEKRVPTAIRIESSPPGGFVMMSRGNQFQEDKAAPLGRTPLFRRFALPETGASLQITKAGYEEWSGCVSPSAPAVKAELVPLTDESKRTKGWFVSPPYHRIIVVPMQLGTKNVGTKDEALETTADSTDFKKRFMATFSVTLKKRLGTDPVIREDPTLASDNCCQELLQNMKSIRPEKVGFYPVPVQMQLTDGTRAALASVGDAVLFVRAEAYYLSSGAQFGRVATAILLSAGSAAGAYSAASAAPGQVIHYPVFGPGASGDLILVQLYLVHAKTRELLWFGQMVNHPCYFKIDDNTEKTARQAAEQVPSAFLLKQCGSSR